MHVTTTDLGISLSHPLDHIRKFAFVYPSIPSRPSILIVFSSPALQAAHMIAAANQDSLQVMSTDAQDYQCRWGDCKHATESTLSVSPDRKLA